MILGVRDSDRPSIGSSAHMPSSGGCSAAFSGQLSWAGRNKRALLINLEIRASVLCTICPFVCDNLWLSHSMVSDQLDLKKAGIQRWNVSYQTSSGMAQKSHNITSAIFCSQSWPQGLSRRKAKGNRLYLLIRGASKNWWSFMIY